MTAPTRSVPRESNDSIARHNFQLDYRVELNVSPLRYPETGGIAGRLTYIVAPAFITYHSAKKKKKLGRSIQIYLSFCCTVLQPDSSPIT